MLDASTSSILSSSAVALQAAQEARRRFEWQKLIGTRRRRGYLPPELTES
jgi:hypothetical protein